MFSTTVRPSVSSVSKAYRVILLPSPLADQRLFSRRRVFWRITALAARRMVLVDR